MSHVRQHLKNLMLPIAMVGGAVFYPWMGHLTFLSPYLIFMMLTVTYCRLNPKEVRLSGIQWWLLSCQVLLSAAAYFGLAWWNHTVAEGVFICVFIPTATAAPVITAMLGGNLSRLVTYSLISNLMMAIFGPIVLAAVGDHGEITFARSFMLICSKVFPLIVMPMALAFLMRWLAPKAHRYLADQQSISFYMWAFSLFIVVGSSVAFAINNYTPAHLPLMLWLALGALVACLVQFKVGRVVGRRFGDPVSGAQGLAQKNTVLAIWLALTYMNPIASIAPAAYVAWQNIINSWQLYRHRSFQNP